MVSACGVATLGSSHRKIIDSGSQRCEIPSFNPGVSLILMIIVHHSEGGEGGTVWPLTLPALQMSQPRPGENGQFSIRLIFIYSFFMYIVLLSLNVCLLKTLKDFTHHPSKLLLEAFLIIASWRISLLSSEWLPSVEISHVRIIFGRLF